MSISHAKEEHNVHHSKDKSIEQRKFEATRRFYDFITRPPTTSSHWTKLYCRWITAVTKPNSSSRQTVLRKRQKENRMPPEVCSFPNSDACSWLQVGGPSRFYLVENFTRVDSGHFIKQILKRMMTKGVSGLQGMEVLKVVIHTDNARSRPSKAT